jgi:hypothetical protein
MSTYEVILDEVRRAWSDVPAANLDDIASIRIRSGKESAQAFEGVKPIDVDIESTGFLSATPLFELRPRAAAAYLGTYLIFYLDDYGIQLAAGVPTDVFNRAHLITFLTRPNFWADFARPHLDGKCIDALGKTVAFVIEHAEDLLLSDKEIDRLGRLLRSIRRYQDAGHGV